MIVFQLENWFDVKEEMTPLFPLHWEEVAGNKDKIKLSVWWDVYDAMAREGQLHVITIRNKDLELVGYHWSIVRPHLHYKDSLTAYTDLYFLLPEYRKGFNGVRLFRFVEKYLKKIGVQKMYSASKVKHDKSPIFERLGWDRTEVVYSKYIGD